MLIALVLYCELFYTKKCCILRVSGRKR